MPLVLANLKDSLEADWLVEDAGSTLESAKRFAQAVAPWFASAQGAGIPGSTAFARQPQLEAQAAAALQIGQSQGAGAALALAVAAYYAGQVFGPGIATFPTALPGGIALMVGTFSDLEPATSDRAQQIASACHLMALSTPVVNSVTGIPGPLT